MIKSWYIGRLFGVDTYVHWSSWILVAWIVLTHSWEGGFLGVVGTCVTILGIFVSIYLHEVGHARVAQAYQIGTRHITLYPFGGLAVLEAAPVGLAEVAVALAGPVVNLILAMMIAIGLLITGLHPPLATTDFESLLNQDRWSQWFAINLLLALVNLLPIFPLDGARVLRGLLAWRWDQGPATRIATRWSRLLAIGMIVVGLFTNWFLVMFGIFALVAGAFEMIQFHMTQGAPFPFGPTPPFPRSGEADSDGDTIEAEDVRRVPS